MGDFEYDESDLIAPPNGLQVPPLRPVETVQRILQNIIAGNELSKEDLRLRKGLEQQNVWARKDAKAME